MNYRILVGWVLSAGLVANAQQVNLRGKVTDAAGKALSGATVTLVTAAHSATTGADGTYALNFTITALRPHANRQSDAMSFDKGMLDLAVTKAAPIKIEIFDVRGNLLDRQALEKASVGTYRLNMAGRVRSENLLIIKASIGSLTQSFRYIQTANGEGMALTSLEAINPAAASLAKAAATVDVLKVSNSGYTTKTVNLESYDATVDVTLEVSSGGGGTDRWGGLKNPAKKSSGCGKASTVASGTKNITSGSQQREYIIDIPASYDMNKPYRLFYCSHWIGSTDDAVANGSVNPGGGAANWGYYGLKRMATTNNDPAIFIAPQGIGGSWGQVDHALFDNLLAYAKENLCIDESRVFITGFSFGGMITYSLSTNHQTSIRAAVGIAPANYNIWLPNPILHDPIAWMSTTGTSDGTCPWGDGATRGAQAIAKQRGTDNGCTVPATVPKNSTSKSHTCYDFEGCKAGYPVKACTFDGGHIAAHADGGTGDNGLTSWIPTESWKFFTQF